MSRGHVGNPYPLDRSATADRFVGRSGLIRDLRSRLKSGDWRRPIALRGPLGIGKTSLLHQLEREVVGDWRILIVDLETEGPRQASDPAGLISRSVAASQNGSSGLSHPESGEALSEGLEGLGSPIVLALEGWDVLLAARNGAIAEWDRTLRDLRSGDGLKVAVLWTGERLAPGWLSEEPDRVMVLEGLDRPAAEAMIRGPAEAVMTYDWEATERILSATRGHPGQIQLLCHDLFETCLAKGRVRLRDVEEAMSRLDPEAREYLRRLRERSTPDEREVLDRVSSMRGLRGVYLRDELRAGARRGDGGRSVDRGGDTGLEGLVDRGILVDLGGQAYGAGSELLGSWMFEEIRSSGGIAQKPPVAAHTPGPRLGRSIAPVASAAVVLTLLAWSVMGDRGRAVAPSPTPTAAPAASAPIVVPTAPPFEIAFMVWDTASETWEIAVITSDGTHRRQLTRNSWNDSWPAWSRDGRLIYFVSEQDGNREIYAMQADGSEPQNLSRHPAPDSNPALSPDGDRLAFASRRDGNWEIYQSDADGSQAARMTFHEAFDYAPRWSPDGRQIAFVSDRDGELEVFVMNADGARLVQLTHNESTDASPAWSPDGTHLVFQSYRDGDMEIYIMMADGSDQRNVSNRPLFDDQEPAWSPDGTQVIFSSRGEEGWNLYRADLGSGEVSKLTNTADIEQAPVWRWGIPSRLTSAALPP